MQVQQQQQHLEMKTFLAFLFDDCMCVGTRQRLMSAARRWRQLLQGAAAIGEIEIKIRKKDRHTSGAVVPWWMGRLPFNRDGVSLFSLLDILARQSSPPRAAEQHQQQQQPVSE